MPLNRQPLPSYTNFYAYCKGVPKQQVKEELEAHGWQSRKSSWTDYELTNACSALVLEGEDGEPLLHGAMVYDDDTIEVLDRIFNALGCPFTYEFYDEQKTLLFTRTHDG